MRTYTDEPTQLRYAFVNIMLEHAANDPRIVALDADLAGSSGFNAFQKRFPDRFFNCGIAEANMIGIAAGLSAAGKIPFAHSFGTFASRRACDQIYVSGIRTNAHMIIVGSDPGVTAAINGGTHMPFEDMSVLRGIPKIKLIEPTDSVILRGIFDELIKKPAVYYLRLKRKNTPAIYNDSDTFNIGKANIIRKGKSASIICSGIMVAESLKAADILETEGIDVTVVNMHTWKPVDEDVIAWCSRETGAIVTAENHNIFGGLGGAVCEAVCRLEPCRVEPVGVNDELGEVGDEEFLKARFGLTADNIVKAVKRAISHKK
jgi:transketolase